MHEPEVETRLRNIEQLVTGIKNSISEIPVVNGKGKLHLYIVAYFALTLSIFNVIINLVKTSTTTTQSINIDSLEKLLENENVRDVLRQRGEIDGRIQFTD